MSLTDYIRKQERCYASYQQLRSATEHYTAPVDVFLFPDVVKHASVTYDARAVEMCGLVRVRESAMKMIVSEIDGMVVRGRLAVVSHWRKTEFYGSLARSRPERRVIHTAPQ